MQATLDSLIDELVSLTSMLKSEVEHYAKENQEGPDNWVDLLEKRQQVIDQISLQLQLGGSLTEEHKHRMAEVQLVDQQLMSLIVENKNRVQGQINQLNKTKLINQQYNGYGMKTAYGAFFDKKK